jgi:hypothetical protein
MARKTDPESVVRKIKTKNRRKYSSEEKILIVLEGFRGAETPRRVFGTNWAVTEPVAPEPMFFRVILQVFLQFVR